MAQYEQLNPELEAPTKPLLRALKRAKPILIAVLAIGLATGVAFIALVWLDSLIRFFSPSVIRLGQTEFLAHAPRAAVFTSDQMQALQFAVAPQASAPENATAH